MAQVISSPDHPDIGRLQISLTSSITAYPIADASISISYTGVPESTLEQLTTNSSGQTETIDLPAPPVEYSTNPENEVQPYSEYTFQVTAEGYEPVTIAGAEILADVTALQNIALNPVTAPASEDASQEEIFVIPAHTLTAIILQKSQKLRSSPFPKVAKSYSAVWLFRNTLSFTTAVQGTVPQRITMSATKTILKM